MGADTDAKEPKILEVKQWNETAKQRKQKCRVHLLVNNGNIQPTNMYTYMDVHIYIYIFIYVYKYF